MDRRKWIIVILSFVLFTSLSIYALIQQHLFISVVFVVIGVSIITAYWIFNKKYQELLINQHQFEEVLDNSNDMTYQIDLQTGEYKYMSKSIVNALGYSFEEIYDAGPKFFLSRIHPDDVHLTQVPKYGDLSEGITDNFQSEIEFRIKKKNGNYIWAYLRRTLLFDKDGKPVSVVGNGYDITDRMMVREKLDHSLKEKEVLLSEIHHRVKNNLAVISSLLLLQKDTSENPHVQDALTDSSNRVQSIADIHELLYQNETFSHIKLNKYTGRLFERIVETHSKNKAIDYQIDCDKITLNINQAIPLGLLINELITNSCKHAFNGSDKGKISFQAQLINNTRINLTYKDSGSGMSSQLFNNSEESDTLGLQLIHALFSQIAASYQLVDSDDGFHLEFSMDLKN